MKSQIIFLTFKGGCRAMAYWQTLNTPLAKCIQEMADDNNTCDLIAARAHTVSFTLYASDERITKITSHFSRRVQIWTRARWAMSHWLFGRAYMLRNTVAYCGTLRRKQHNICSTAPHPVWTQLKFGDNASLLSACCFVVTRLQGLQSSQFQGQWKTSRDLFNVDHTCNCCVHICTKGVRNSSYYSARSSASAEYWIYLMGQFGGVHAFGCNSAESEPIWIKSGGLWEHHLRLTLADFRRDMPSSDSLGARRNFVIFVRLATHDLIDFPSAKFNKIWTQNVDRCFDEHFRNRILKILS